MSAVYEGFSFENCLRNEAIQKHMAPPKILKTGTTTVALVFKDGVIMGADTRATSGPIIATKNCAKIHHLADNIYCCGAGTAADCDFVAEMIRSRLRLQELNMCRKPRVSAAVKMSIQHLFQYQGYIGANLIVGGVDTEGSHVYYVDPHGAADSIPFTTMGSGSVAAMSVLEEFYRPELPLEEAKKIVRDAVAAGVFNDLGSGSNIDLCVITDEGVEYLRPYDVANLKGVRRCNYASRPGDTRVVAETVRRVKYNIVSTATNKINDKNMDID